MNTDRTDDWPDERRDGIWPRVYRPSRGQRLFMDVTGAVTLAIGLGALGTALFWRPEKEAAVWIVSVMLVGLCLAMVGAYGIVWNRSRRVLLFEDAIEFVELGFGRRRLHRDEIAGLRIISTTEDGRPVQFVFEFHRPERKPVKTSLCFCCERDAVLCDWLAALPDLDALDRARAEHELLRRPELGRTEEERRRSLAKARTIVCAVTVLTLAAAAWGWFYPQPHMAAIVTLAAIPLATVALLLEGRGRYVIWDDPANLRPPLCLPLFMPGLLLPGLVDFVVDWQPLLLWAVLGAIALTAVLVVGDPTLPQRWFVPLVMLLLLVPHTWGTLQMANALLDRSEPERFRVAVLDKHIDPEDRPSHYLRLAPWGPVPRREVTVDRELYQAVEVSGTVCVVLRSGRSASAGSTSKPATDRGLMAEGKLGVAAPSLRKPMVACWA